MTINVPVMTPQNFMLAAGYNQVITFNVDPAVVSSLIDTVIWWRFYEEALGIPTGPPILEKAAPDIVSYDSPLSFTVQMYTADTINLLRNYYHESSIFDATGELIGGSFGIMTVIPSLNVEPSR